MNKNAGLRMVVGIIFLGGMIVGTAVRATAASQHRAIGNSGQRLSSLFEGLKPNPLLQSDRLVSYQPSRRVWRGIGASRLPGLSRVNIIIGDSSCPTSPCAGNYTVFFPQPGGCTAVGCPSVEDFFIDVQNGDCTIGSMDVECGDGNSCCANAVECSSPNTAGCPTN